MLPSLEGRDILLALRDPAKTPNFHSKVVVITNLEQDSASRAEIGSMADGYMVKDDVTPHDVIDFLAGL
jgi:DNA-binding NarL/FixJ family response regulator